jgi:hypothetical protein
LKPENENLLIEKEQNTKKIKRLLNDKMELEQSIKDLDKSNSLKEKELIELNTKVES